MKQQKEHSQFRLLWLYLVFSVVLLIGIWLIFDPPVSESPYMDKADMFEIVRNNTQTILEDIKKDDFTRTLDLLSSSQDEPHVSIADSCVTFDCYGSGFASHTIYEGFYYTPEDTPGWPYGWQGEALNQEGAEWVWYENSGGHGGDNEYHTEKICDHFWYFKQIY